MFFRDLKELIQYEAATLYRMKLTKMVQLGSQSCLPCFCRSVRCNAIAPGLPASSGNDTDVVPPTGHTSCWKCTIIIYSDLLSM